MRLAIINATGGGFSGGYRKYLQELVPLLQSDARIVELSIWYPASLQGQVSHDSKLARYWAGSPRFSAPPELQRALRSERYDLLFFPTQRIFPGLTKPAVCMVRNMEPLTRCWQRRTFSGLLGNTLRHYVARHAVRHSRGVIAVSQFVRTFLEERWGVSPEKTSVVYHGVAQPSGDAQQPDWAASLDSPFVFSAGSLLPYRGFEDLIHAAADEKLKRRRLHFVLAGQEAQGDSARYGAMLRRLIQELGVGGRVSLAGTLSQGEMAWAYQNCACFVATSRVEACPNIALEALASGCLTISNNCAPHPEFFGSAANYYRPGRSDELAERIVAAMQMDATNNHAARAAAQERAASFSWAQTAEQTVTFLARQLGGLSTKRRHEAIA